MLLQQEKQQNLQLKRCADILRGYEAYAYQVALYLLQDEELALQAVKQALTALLQAPLDEYSETEKQMKIRNTCVKFALQAKVQQAEIA